MNRKSATFSISAAAYLTIRDKILNGEYPPGAPVTRRRLAEELGVSLTPVTEALKRLELDGLTESLPRIGTRVKIPKPEDIVGHYQLREALETQSARLFAVHATAKQKAAFIERARKLDHLYSSFSRERVDWRRRLFLLHKTHMDFHRDIANATNSRSLTAAMERSSVLIFNWLYNSAANVERLPQCWHEELMKTLAAGDPEAADNAMRRHTQFAMGEIVKRVATESGLAPTQMSFRGPQKKTIGNAIFNKLRSANNGSPGPTKNSSSPTKAFGVDGSRDTE